MNINFDPEEIGYMSGLLKAPLDYFRMLSGHPKCSDINRAKLEFLETLYLKLNPPPFAAASQNGKRPRTGNVSVHP